MHIRFRFSALLIVGAFISAPVIAQEHRHDTEEALKKLSAALGLKAGSVVADVGAGDGAYSVPLAKTVGPSGRVIAVDISTRALERLRARLERDAVTNIAVVQGDVDNPKLDPGSVDAVLIVNAYHEMTEYQAMLRHIRAALKPEGRLVIADFASPSRRGESRDQQTRRHEIAPELVLQEVRAAGFAIVGFEDPFSAGHGHADHVEWVLTLAPTAPSAPSAPLAPSAVLPDIVLERAALEVSSPELRISFNDFLALHREQRLVLLDVRDPIMFGRGRIPGARLAPMDKMRDFVAELKTEQRPIVTYCDCPAEEASARAAVYLQQRGIANVRALLGGWDKWLSSAQPVEKDR